MGSVFSRTPEPDPNWNQRELWDAEERQREAERIVCRAREAVERATCEAEEQRQRAHEAEVAASRAAQAAHDAAERIRQEVERAERRAREEAAERATGEQRQRDDRAEVAALRAVQAAHEERACEEAEVRTREEEARARQEVETRAREAAEGRTREEEALARQEAETRAREEAEARAREQEARAERILQEMEEQRRRQEAEATAAREEEARRQMAAEEEIRLARQAQEEAEQKAHEAAEAARKAQAEREEIEGQLRIGIWPVVVPTPEEIRLAKAKVQCDDAIFHFAVAGIAGSGKSSLINAIRGLNNNDPHAAPAGVNETTLEISSYAHTTRNLTSAWYDIPGSGTLGTPDWQYFNSQGLYTFDCILVLFSDSFTTTDLTILANCHRFQIPTFIVRSKSDQHILNIMTDMGYDSDKENTNRRAQFYKVARQRYISETRRSVRRNLTEANLPDQRVYTVSKKTLLGAVKDQGPKGIIDEVELLTDLYHSTWATTSYKKFT
ncbi:P-loop containing nucleoside triphosphate hydrolase protein [Pisolithus marmoratus]|nr:P-loop containing nucleoside triphosphate hydrolase protein [Pisolithus marmoratus]